MNILEQIQTAQYGKTRPVRVSLFKNGVHILTKNFATHLLAWAYGCEWEWKSPEYSFKIH